MFYVGRCRKVFEAVGSVRISFIFYSLDNMLLMYLLNFFHPFAHFIHYKIIYTSHVI